MILQTTVNRGTSIAGTWNYMASEAFEPQAFAEGIGKHTDVWALACVIVQMRTGQRPWVDMQMQQISRAVCDQQHTPPAPQDAPAAALLHRCSERRPTQRPTAADLADTFASDVREGVESPCPTLVRGLAVQREVENLSHKTVVSTVLVIFVGRRHSLSYSRCRDCYYCSILHGIVMRMRAHTLTIANCAHNHKHTGVAACHGRGVYGSSWH